jgi:hypothetical protein
MYAVDVINPRTVRAEKYCIMHEIYEKFIQIVNQKTRKKQISCEKEY